MNEQAVNTPYFDIWLEDGIIYEVFKPDTEITLPLAKEVVSIRMKLAGNKIHPIFVDIRNLIYADSASRKYWASAEGTQLLKAGAFLVNHPLNKFLFDIFLLLNHPIIPTKPFCSKEKAINWLQQYKS